MGDFLKFSYREFFKKHVKKLIFSGFWSKQPKKKPVKIGYFYINQGKLFFISAKVSSFLPPILGEKFVFFAGYCKNW